MNHRSEHEDLIMIFWLMVDLILVALVGYGVFRFGEWIATVVMNATGLP